MATDTALLVIDMQVGNVGAAYQHENHRQRPGVPGWLFPVQQ